MSAWADMQQQWAKNLDESKITGVLLWDLSAAFDTDYIFIQFCRFLFEVKLSGIVWKKVF